MGFPDEEKTAAENSVPNLDGGKDLLYGWLVGRAAADLGLAQALARSEAQRSEQIKRLEENLLGQIRELQNPQSADEGVGSAAIDALRSELQRVDEKQRQSAAQWIDVEQLESALGEKLQQLESQIQRQTQASSGADLAEIKFELKLLVDRIARAEHAAQQAQAGAASQHQQVEELIAAQLDESLAARVGELREQLCLALNSHERDQRLSEMQSELQLIGQRLIQAESSAQQTHVRVVSDAAQSAELRDGVARKLAAIESQLAEQRASDANREDLGRQLSARLDLLQEQLERSLALLDSRGAEIAELRVQVRNLAQNISAGATAKPDPQTAPVHRPQAPIGVTVGLSAVKAPSETTVPVLKAAAGEPNILLKSYDAESNGLSEQKKQLQQRISADIERVRAELRKRAGVGR